jgi:hypothetical protein
MPNIVLAVNTNEIYTPYLDITIETYADTPVQDFLEPYPDTVAPTTGTAVCSQSLPVASNTITLTANEETLHQKILVATNVITLTASAATVSVDLSTTTNIITLTPGEEEFVPGQSQISANTNQLTVVASTAEATATIPASEVTFAENWVVENNTNTFIVAGMYGPDGFVVESNQNTWIVF